MSITASDFVNPSRESLSEDGLRDVCYNGQHKWDFLEWPWLTWNKVKALFEERQDDRMGDDKILMPERPPSHLWNEITAVLQ